MVTYEQVSILRVSQQQAFGNKAKSVLQLSFHCPVLSRSAWQARRWRFCCCSRPAPSCLRTAPSAEPPSTSSAVALPSGSPTWTSPPCWWASWSSALMRRNSLQSRYLMYSLTNTYLYHFQPVDLGFAAVGSNPVVLGKKVGQGTTPCFRFCIWISTI